MSELIESLTIKDFRGFSELNIPAFGKVNLITGKNNAGKSSVLEAILILASRGSLEACQYILSYREEITSPRSEQSWFNSPADFRFWRGLFRGYPEIWKERDKEHAFSISASGRIPAAQSSLETRACWHTWNPNPEGSKQTPVSKEPALALIEPAETRYSPLSAIRSAAAIDTPSEILCIHIDSFSSRTTRDLAERWDAIALTDAQEYVVNALKLIAPDITAVNMIGGDGNAANGRTAVVRSTRFPSPIPLRSYGDGINRLFGIILSLCNARDGILLIDEFENGLHYSVQPLIWKTIFQLAKDMNVQVFATTHSRDCVHAFQEAANESPEDGRLIRLTRKNDIVIPTVFKETELQIAAENDIEVR